jgi:hypothetical protein
MKTRKCVAAIVVSLALISMWAQLAPRRCGALSAWFPTLDYDAWAALALPGMILFLLYNPVYDLLAFAYYRLGYEPRFDGSLLYPEDSNDETPPLTLNQKLFFAYPAMLFFAVAILAIWSRMVFCI